MTLNCVNTILTIVTANSIHAPSCRNSCGFCRSVVTHGTGAPLQKGERQMADALLDLLSERGLENAPIYEAYPLGESFYFRNAVYSLLGRVVGYCSDGDVLILDQASYVATDGRFGEFVRDGSHPNAETEYAGDGVRLPVRMICDATPFRHNLPRSSQ